MLFFLIFLFHFSFSAKFFYISNFSNCTNCDGSEAQPYNGIIDGFLNSINYAMNNNDFDISLELLSENYYIFQNDLKKVESQANIKKFNNAIFQFFDKSNTPFSSLTIKPRDCNLDLNQACNKFANIFLKTSNFSISTSKKTIVRNINFYGNDLIYDHQSILKSKANISKECLTQINVNCCNLDDFNKNTSNCYLANLDISKTRKPQTENDYQFGLFLFKYDFTSLKIQNCGFFTIIAIGANSLETFNFLVGVYQNAKLQKAGETPILLQNLSLSIDQCIFKDNYFYLGILYFGGKNAINTKTNIVRSEFYNYNSLNIVDADLIDDFNKNYNYFMFFFKNSSEFIIEHNKFINCFKVINIDNVDLTEFKNNSYIIDYKMKEYPEIDFTREIKIIAGNSQNIIQFSANQFSINPWNSNLLFSNLIFDFNSHTTISIFEQAIDNMKNMSIGSFMNSTLLNISNVQIENLDSIPNDLITSR